MLLMRFVWDPRRHNLIYRYNFLQCCLISCDILLVFAQIFSLNGWKNSEGKEDKSVTISLELEIILFFSNNIKRERMKEMLIYIFTKVLYNYNLVITRTTKALLFLIALNWYTYNFLFTAQKYQSCVTWKWTFLSAFGW